MNSEAATEPLPIRFLGVNLSSEVGANDSILAVRVVPDRREGETIYGRTLRADEVDEETPILISPSAGERLVFPPQSIEIKLIDADRQVQTEPDGYRPITNTIWTWLFIGSPADPALFRYLLAAARRLDGTHALLTETRTTMSDLPEGFIGIRSRLYRALALAEILVVALGRVVDMLDDLPKHFASTPPLPEALEAKKAAIRQMRNAFEHIEDRALGNVNRKPHPDALSVFEQRAFVREHKLVYASHSLELGAELQTLLMTARAHIYEIAAHVAGHSRKIAARIEFFDQGSREPRVTLD